MVTGRPNSTTFAYRAVSLWNMLDEDLRNATTVKALKKALNL